ncbi:hypothetical protein IEQ34_004413 [Dendrobium chrysotoxum]|uniref:Exocyst subunit Exo70 family protein n=1 Tax=Dendrobium chrysotoxum TaxID=161865 RepID=A0AAV7GZG3_DENCH|nr:hypothetical protein IEQ34_004413 [Dendrobium chrysotoxum]
MPLSLDFGCLRVGSDGRDDFKTFHIPLNDFTRLTERYDDRCFQVYGGIRNHFGIKRLSICDVQRLEWDTLESNIRRWIYTISPFVESVKSAAIQLLSFIKAISIGHRSSEKLFKVLGLHGALTDLLPDIAIIFQSKALESINTHVVEIIDRLAKAAREILSEFEGAILREPSKFLFVEVLFTCLQDFNAAFEEVHITQSIWVRDGFSTKGGTKNFNIRKVVTSLQILFGKIQTSYRERETPKDVYN